MPINIDDLTGYTWKANDGFYIEHLPTREFNINFISNNTNYTKFSLVWHTDDVFYTSLDYNDAEVQSEFDGWSSDAYKTITIIDGDAVKNTDLIEFLQDQGTLTKESENKIKLGESDVILALGETEVSRVYLGETLVYEKQ